jgi:predicted naringenin-chalcone synthase
VSEREAVQRSEVTGWILHGGGRKVIEELQSHLSLGDEECASAARCCASTAT